MHMTNYNQHSVYVFFNSCPKQIYRYLLLYPPLCICSCKLQINTIPILANEGVVLYMIVPCLYVLHFTRYPANMLAPNATIWKYSGPVHEWSFSIVHNNLKE